MVKYTKEEIRAAVDIAIGDDGFRSRSYCNIRNVGKRKNWSK